MLDIFVFIVIISSIIYLFIENIKLKKTSAKLVADLFAEIMEKSVLSKQLKEEISKQNLVGNEDFVKFISESRDVAYKYIEDVQKGIKDFVDSIEPEIRHFDTYGDVIDTPLHEPMRKISKEFKKLKTFIPEDVPND